MTSPRYPLANGKLENTVKTRKNIIEKAKETKQDVYMSFLDFRNTPSESIGTSSAQRLFGGRTRTQMPEITEITEINVSPKLLQATAQKETDVSGKRHRAKQRQARNYDEVSKILPPITPDQNVSKRPAGHRSYIVESGGRLYRRNRRRLRTTKKDCRPSPLVSDDSEEDENDGSNNDDVVPGRLNDTSPKQTTAPIQTPPPRIAPDIKKTTLGRAVKLETTTCLNAVTLLWYSLTVLN